MISYLHGSGTLIDIPKMVDTCKMIRMFRILDFYIFDVVSTGSKKVIKGIPGYKQPNNKNVLLAVKKQIKSGAGAKVSSGPSKSLRYLFVHAFSFSQCSLY